MAQSEIRELRDDDYILLDKEGRRTISGRFLKEIIASGGSGGGFSVAWDDVTGKPTFGALATRDNITNTQVASNANIALSKLANVQVNAILVMTQAQYDAVATKDPNTLYLVRD